ncbi:putative Zn-dependent peptidase [Desulfocurvibacter africanus PCS]|uniref:Putative Zn-dependent peptidase n=2 Tax=Desulfocurvibacter africanus TaxID=873 RepID=M5Q2L3_DESAF|nr:putative Zn-dependent peptidase [Desulfocurvibacter africanus PCS]
MSMNTDSIVCASQLDNGIRVVTERIPATRSASLGIWIEAGSLDEKPNQEGMAHFWEHMAFKGTLTRTALDIAKDLDRLGGFSNAFTGREHTCFHARMVDTGLADAMDILSDIVLRPRLDPSDILLEQDVVLQEIAMVNDTPEDFLFEHFWSVYWTEPAMAHSILGNDNTVQGFVPAMLDAWRQEHYKPGRMLVAAAGAVDHENLVNLASRTFGSLPPANDARQQSLSGVQSRRQAIDRDMEQTHVLLGFPGVALTDERRFALAYLNSLLGGQMSSRLFQEVRERRGLAYSVYSSHQALANQGVLQVYAATQPGKCREMLSVILQELHELAQGKVDEAEIAHCRDHLLGMLYLGTESSEDRMLRLAKNHYLFGRHVPVEETAAKLNAVNLDDIRAVARDFLAPDQPCLCVLGPDVDESLWKGLWD